MKTIGVLTSGGDAPGMNAAVRAVVRTACENGIKVYGINRGYQGLIEGDLRELNIRSVSDIIHRGGTMLYSARCKAFREESGMQQAIDTCKKFGIEGIVVIGGDGSFRGARDLSLRGIPCIGVPGTIDNDIVSSDYTIGYDTCLNTVMQMVDRVRDTVESHSRCIVVEVMGNRCGDLTLPAGIAVGATAIVIPEIQSDIEKHVIERIRRTQKTDKKHFIVMVAEGIGGVEELARKIEKALFPASISPIRSRSSSTGMFWKPSICPRLYSPTVRVSSKVTLPSRGRLAASDRCHCFKPLEMLSIIKPAMFTGSFAEE